MINTKQISYFLVLWFIWTLLGSTLLYGVLSADHDGSSIALFAIILSLAPFMGLMLALGSPKAARQFNTWLNSSEKSIYLIGGGMALLYSLPGILTLTFNPYHAVIFTFIAFITLGLSRQNKNASFRLGWGDLALWFILWIPFDLRWFTELYPAFDYTWWSIVITVIAVIGWNGYRGADVGYRLVPNLKDFRITLLALVLLLGLLVPPGLLSGFLTFSMPESYDIPKLAAGFIGLFLTVALPEELFFRGILLRGLDSVSSKKWIPIVVSSLAFGLMHWNNVNDLPMQIAYVTLATIAGLGYGWTYRKSGNNLFAAILVHTLVDWIWGLFLGG